MDARNELLDTLFDHWRENAREAEKVLGAEKAHFFVDVYNDALNIGIALSDCYPDKQELLTSMVYADFMGLCKEIHWLELMFLAGNYPLLLSRLRYDWEMIFRALYADTYEKEKDTDPEPPGPTLDEKHEWLGKLEEQNRLNANTIIYPLLRQLLRANDPDEIEAYFRPLWKGLNAFVHPSATVRDRLVRESALLVRDGFDEELAKEALYYATEVFELIWLAVTALFPKTRPVLIADANTFRQCERLRHILVGQSDSL